MQAQDPQLDVAPPVETPTAARRRSPTRWAIGIVFIAYLAVWAGLVAGLLSRPASFGEFGDPRLLGVVFVSVTLGAAFVASIVWIAAVAIFRLTISTNPAPARSMLLPSAPPIVGLVALGLFWLQAVFTVGR